MVVWKAYTHKVENSSLQSCEWLEDWAQNDKSPQCSCHFKKTMKDWYMANLIQRSMTSNTVYLLMTAKRAGQVDAWQQTTLLDNRQSWQRTLLNKCQLPNISVGSYIHVHCSWKRASLTPKKIDSSLSPGLNFCGKSDKQLHYQREDRIKWIENRDPLKVVLHIVHSTP